jgi:L,D-peptidoglycan transpeptidase YkuD (ErfK/YbiS/YcfS/YnhG family)
MVCLLLTALLTSCSSDSELDNTSAAADKVVTFGAHIGFAEDTITRAAQQPETKRIILSDGLLVDATLVDEGNMPGTRATTTYEPITTGTGMAFVCSGTTIVRKQNIAVSGGQITVMVPPTGTYTIYMYLNEDGNLSLTDATIPDNNVNNVTIGSRPVNSKDDYVSVPNISAGSTTLGSPITFTPLGSEVRVNMQAGVTPLTGFETTFSGVQANQSTNVNVATGTYNASSTSGADLTLKNDNSTNTINIYSNSLTSNGARFFSLNQSVPQTAVLTINSISGPDGGTAPTVKKTYTSANTMKFSHAYVNGHRYNLILRLATPITGSIDWHNGTSTGVWPALNGAPAYYEWDAKAPEPIGGAKPTQGSNSYYNYSAVPAAQNSCKYCPCDTECTWYKQAGTYWDNSRWYCPAGGLGVGSTVYAGGGWLKKSAKIQGFSNKIVAPGFADGFGAPKPTNGKPGISKLNATDANQQNPNDWFFLPGAYGTDGTTSTTVSIYSIGQMANYWCRNVTHNTMNPPYEHLFQISSSDVNLYLIPSSGGMCYNADCIWLVQ